MRHFCDKVCTYNQWHASCILTWDEHSAAIGVVLTQNLTILSLPALVIFLSTTSRILLLSYYNLWFDFKYRVIEDDNGTDGGIDPNEEEIWDAIINCIALGVISGHIISYRFGWPHARLYKAQHDFVNYPAASVDVPCNDTRLPCALPKIL
jgi:hypothetical protein